MPAKNKLELQLSAERAANTALKLTTPYQVETSSLDAFNAEANDPADWPDWKNMFTDRLNHYAVLQKQPTASAQAAAAAATKTAAPAAAK